jgi:hypothetical protein
MKRLLKLIAILFFASLAVWFLAPVGSGQVREPKASEKFKNIKVLREMPADQLGKAMNMMSASLGVDCGFCHISGSEDFEKDGNEHKDVTREMISMTFDINKRYFEGRPVINCNTCHNGMPMPKATFPLAPLTRLPRLLQPVAKPDVEGILDRYLEATGGREAAAKMTSRIVTALRLEPDGKTVEPETIWQKGGKSRTETRYGDYVVTEVYDGRLSMKFGGGEEIGLKADEADEIRREALVFGQPDLRRSFGVFEYHSLDRVDGREVHVVKATDGTGAETLLHFDVESGLLVRRRASVPTVFGDFVTQMDYADYKVFRGVKFPTTVRFAVPGIYWTRKISDIRVNAEVPDSKFGK